MHKQKTVKSERFDPRVLVKRLRSERVPISERSEIINRFFIALDTPISLSCYLMFKYEEFDQLVSKDIRPSDYTLEDSELFKRDFAAVSFLRKNQFLRTSFQRKALALDAFAKAEESCKDTNFRLRNTDSLNKYSFSGADVLLRARRKISNILQSFCVDEFLDLCTWGPGSTLKVTGVDTTAPSKFNRDRQVTREAHYLFGSLLSSAYPNWLGDWEPDFVVGNKIITVPKNAKIDRTIAIEPGINSWIQLGIGKLIRKRLRRYGFDLNSDLKNRLVARKSSRDGYSATVDFRAASDTISIELVKLLLPPRWFSILDSARSHYYNLYGTTHSFEKFSTMGNGFTFELESLIFLSIALALCELRNESTDEVSIFGDDLTIPAVLVPELDHICKHVGFTINIEKSFFSGYFRESCGDYYFNGLDVKPLFLKKEVIEVKDLYRLANALLVLSSRHSCLVGLDRRFKSVWGFVVSLVPKDLRLFGPLSSGDATINISKSYADCKRSPNGLDGYVFSAFPSVGLTFTDDSYGQLLTRLHRRSEMEYGNNSTLRSKTKYVFKKRMFSHQWCDLGLWT